MHRGWVRQTQRVVALSAWLIASCSASGGPGPEIPLTEAGASGAGGVGGMGGANGGSGGRTDSDAGAGVGGVGGVASGGVGGNAGMSATGGSGGVGGGAGVGEPVVSCTDSDAVAATTFGATPNVDLQTITHGTTIGINGTFADECDAQGDLLEQICETQFGCGTSGRADAGGAADAACAPQHHPTGYVEQRVVDCLGMCADGVCNIPCPLAGDELTVTEVVSTAQQYELDSGTAGLRYSCTRGACAVPAASVGDVLTVVSVAEPDDLRPDCRVFADPSAPLTLSDGCTYMYCAAVASETP
jgi:hypothetical protein